MERHGVPAFPKGTYGLIGTILDANGDTWQVIRTVSRGPRQRWPYIAIREYDGYTNDTLALSDLPKFGDFTPLPEAVAEEADPGPVDIETTAEYPHPSGEFIVIGPECFIDPKVNVICYKGENYVQQVDAEDTVEGKHFAPYGSTNALCGETVPLEVAWDVKSGEYASSRFTVKRDLTTCPDCARRLRITTEGGLT